MKKEKLLLQKEKLKKQKLKSRPCFLLQIKEVAASAASFFCFILIVFWAWPQGSGHPLQFLVPIFRDCGISTTVPHARKIKSFAPASSIKTIPNRAIQSRKSKHRTSRKAEFLISDFWFSKTAYSQEAVYVQLQADVSSQSLRAPSKWLSDWLRMRNAEFFDFSPFSSYFIPSTFYLPTENWKLRLPTNSECGMLSYEFKRSKKPTLRAPNS